MHAFFMELKIYDNISVGVTIVRWLFIECVSLKTTISKSLRGLMDKALAS